MASPPCVAVTIYSKGTSEEGPGTCTAPIPRGHWNGRHAAWPGQGWGGQLVHLTWLLVCSPPGLAAPGSRASPHLGLTKKET